MSPAPPISDTAAGWPQGEPPDLAAALDALAPRVAAVRTAVQSVIYGQRDVIEQTLTVLLAGGHVLLVGVPGVGKSLLVDTLARTLGLASGRVNFTPDLMPGDILGSEVLDEDHDDGGRVRRKFRFLPGPVFTNLLLADEINRASPRTQSALLQAMQEAQVAVAGHPHPLPAPFHVLATQNPIEQEGTYPLPEAQRDRFLLEVDVGYPDFQAERDMLIGTTGPARPVPSAVLDADELREAQALIRRIPVGAAVVDAILRLVRSLRPGEGDAEVDRAVAWGPGPRAAQALLMASRARAVLDGRLSPSLSDVAALAKPAIRHRMALGFAALADGLTADALIERRARAIG